MVHVGVALDQAFDWIIRVHACCESFVLILTLFSSLFQQSVQDVEKVHLLISA